VHDCRPFGSAGVLSRVHVSLSAPIVFEERPMSLTTRVTRLLLAALCLPVLTSTSARANLLGNGSFETPVISADFQVFNNGDAIGAWVVQFTDVDIVRNNILGTNIVAHDGNQWLDLNGFSRGGVFQFIATVPGKKYDFRFWYSDNPFSNGQGSQLGVAKTGTWSVRDGDTSQLILPLGSFTHSTATAASADWRDSGRIRFVATNTTTRIAFSGDAVLGSTGPLIDDVSVNAVPEPVALSLLGAALLGVAARRRRQ
jgi:hypothetical protein